jgi:hypothetical protein
MVITRLKSAIVAMEHRMEKQKKCVCIRNMDIVLIYFRQKNIVGK